VREFIEEETASIRRMKRQGMTNIEIGKHWHRPAGEIDLALWEMLGTTPFDAATKLNSRKAA
jgi:Holliday junction resolvase-like predicted endonuclease